MKAAPTPNPNSFLGIRFVIIFLVSSSKEVPNFVSTFDVLTLVRIGLRAVNCFVLGGIHDLDEDEE